LHRRVIAMEAVVAVSIAAVAVLVVLGVVEPAVGLAASGSALGVYVVLLGAPSSRLRRLGFTASWVQWLAVAVREEESELDAAIHPAPGTARDGALTCLAVLVVVGASVVMERAASELGTRHRTPEIVTGGLVLAVVTSLPNAVAAVYLARRGRGSATLSTAMNSNAINTTAGFLLPAAIVGVGTALGPARLVAGWYLGLTILALLCAYSASGLRRTHGLLIVLAYIAFVAALLDVAT
jgi:Ca2+/Na+ antiporter